MMFQKWETANTKSFSETIYCALYRVDKKYMMLFSPDFKHKIDRAGGSVFYVKSCTSRNIHCSFLQVKMADKGAALNLARKNKQEKNANTMKLDLLS